MEEEEEEEEDEDDVEEDDGEERFSLWLMCSSGFFELSVDNDDDDDDCSFSLSFSIGSGCVFAPKYVVNVARFKGVLLCRKGKHEKA